MSTHIEAFTAFCDSLVNPNAKQVMEVAKAAIAMRVSAPAQSDFLLRIAELMAAVKTSQEVAGIAFVSRNGRSTGASKSKPDQSVSAGLQATNEAPKAEGAETVI